MSEERILKAIGDLRNEVGELRTEMNTRFDEVNKKMDYGFSIALSPHGEWPPPQNFKIPSVAPSQKQQTS